jgi:hypothetical protein
MYFKHDELVSSQKAPLAVIPAIPAAMTTEPGTGNQYLRGTANNLDSDA